MSGVVVGANRTDGSGSAVRWAAEEAALRGLPLKIVHAWNEPVDVSMDVAPESVPGLSGTATSCAIHGPAATVLLAQEPDLLVLGARIGARHLSHLTRTCMHHAACPVIVVPDTERQRTGRVVVGVCGTEASRIALRWAAEEARLRVAELSVVHAWQVHPASAKDVLQPSRAVPAQQGAALDRLEGWVRSVLGSADIELHATHAAPLEGLLEQSADADLLVLGRGVHTGLGRLVRGAVDEDVMGHASCPVAVVPGLLSSARTLV